MAGQHIPARRNIDEALAPAAHAGLGLTRVVIGSDEIDCQAVAELATRGVHRVDGGHQLLAAGHERSAITQAPAVVLGVRHFDALGLPFQRQRDHARHALGVMTVQHRVDRQRQAARAYGCSEVALLRQAIAVARDAVGAGWIHVLHAQLHVFQPGCLQLVQHRLAASDTGGDQIAVQPQRARMRHQLGQILAQLGSPPEKCACSTPISAACSSKERQPAVSISSRSAASAIGLEQYGHANGQRWVSSSNTDSGGGAVVIAAADVSAAGWR